MKRSLWHPVVHVYAIAFFVDPTMYAWNNHHSSLTSRRAWLQQHCIAISTAVVTASNGHVSLAHADTDTTLSSRLNDSLLPTNGWPSITGGLQPATEDQPQIPLPSSSTMSTMPSRPASLEGTQLCIAA
jgi:hypothetical protein